MRLRAWIVDAPAGGVVMQIIEQTGIRANLLTDNLKIAEGPCVYEDGDIFLRGCCKRVDTSATWTDNRTAQSVIDQLTAGLAGHAVTREPKRGDLVEVWNIGSPINRIFIQIAEGAKYKYLVVAAGEENYFLSDSPFLLGMFEHMRPITQPVRYSRSGDVHTWTTEAEKAGEGDRC